MATESDFLRAILDNPDDDVPRLLLCDFLEERSGPGDAERSEFIRVQCELARTPEPAVKTPGNILNLSDEEYDWHNCCGGCRWDGFKKEGALCRYHALRRRELELLAEPGDWTPGILWPDSNSSEWIRGFIEWVNVPADWWIANGPAVAVCQPVRRVELSNKKPIANSFDGVMWSDARPRKILLESDQHVLPGAIYDLLPGPVIHSMTWKGYASVPDAVSALSDACLSYARTPPFARRGDRLVREGDTYRPARPGEEADCMVTEDAYNPMDVVVRRLPGR